MGRILGPVILGTCNFCESATYLPKISKMYDCFSAEACLYSGLLQLVKVYILLAFMASSYKFWFAPLLVSCVIHVEFGLMFVSEPTEHTT